MTDTAKSTPTCNIEIGYGVAIITGEFSVPAIRHAVWALRAKNVMAFEDSCMHGFIGHDDVIRLNLSVDFASGLVLVGGAKLVIVNSMFAEATGLTLYGQQLVKAIERVEHRVQPDR